MDIYTIVKANIRAHRSQYIGIIIMMLVAITSILGLSDIMISGKRSSVDAIEKMGAYDQLLVAYRSEVTPERLAGLDKSSLVGSYRVTDILGVHGLTNSAGKKYHSQPFLVADDGRFRLLEDDLSAVKADRLDVKPGEAYISSGLRRNLDIKTGDKIFVRCEDRTREFTVAGMLEEQWGGDTIGWKNVVISQQDFDEFAKELHEAFEPMGLVNEFEFSFIEINMSSPDISEVMFNKEIDAVSGLFSYSIGNITKEGCKSYNVMIVTIISAVLIVVAIILFIVLLVVISNNIATTIRNSYRQIGIYKSQGFDTAKLRKIYLIQYLSAELLGMIPGVLLSLVLSLFVLRLFAPMVGFVLIPYLNIWFTLGTCFAVLAISMLVIVLSTGRIGKISPHKAISEGHDDISFSSGLSFPISKRALSAGIALRNITSNIPQYIGVAITAMILVVLLFFVIAGKSSLNSKTVLLSMGPVGELSISKYQKLSEAERDDIDRIVEAHAPVRESYTYYNEYVDCEESKVSCLFFDQGKNVKCIYKGRAPEFDNEIAIGNGFAKMTGKKIGDTVIVSREERAYEYLITGYFNTLNELGKVLAMGEAAAEHIGMTEDSYYNPSKIYVLDNPENRDEWYPTGKTQLIVDEINARYGQVVKVKAMDIDVFGSSIGSVMDIVFISIAAIAVIFVMIIVSMSCTKCFKNESYILGIYKAVGFSSGKLRLQFAFRFLLVFIIGGAIGLLLGVFSVDVLYGLIFSFLGTPYFSGVLNGIDMILPLIIVAFFSFVFAFVAARRVKQVDVNELICE